MDSLMIIGGGKISQNLYSRNILNDKLGNY
jgi:hypothetical protein